MFGSWSSVIGREFYVSSPIFHRQAQTKLQTVRLGNSATWQPSACRGESCDPLELLFLRMQWLASYPAVWAAAEVPGHAGLRVVRITSMSSLLSAGFCRKAQAPAFKVRSRLYCGSRAVSTITGIVESC